MENLKTRSIQSDNTDFDDYDFFAGIPKKIRSN